VILVKTNDHNGSMDVTDLMEKLDKHTNEYEEPLFVVCTAGTTVLSAYDNIEAVATICEQRKIWLHVDGCLGAAALFSHKHRKRLLGGIERADSLSWSWHKLHNAPVQTTLFISRHKGLLQSAHSANADYLFATDKHYDVQFDSGDASIQCGRKPDAIKVWLMWRARGTFALGESFDKVVDVADRFVNMIKDNERFRLVCGQAQGTTVCFWVIPPSLKAYGHDLSKIEYVNKLNTVCPELKRRMVERGGKMMITYQPLECKHLPNFFRITFSVHPLANDADLQRMIGLLKEYSNDL